MQLAEGRTVRCAAAALGITYGTAQTRLRIVFNEVGAHSQAQLVACLLGSRRVNGW